MSRLDDELTRAVADSEAQAAEARPSVVEPRREEASRRSFGLLLALVVAGGGILTLVFTSAEDSMVYSKGVDELLAEKGRFAARAVKVEGTLVRGTLVRRDQPCEYRFEIEKNGARLPVVYSQCVVPDTFRDVPGMDVQVTTEGRLNGAGTFEATHIMAKCPSKYEMQDRAARGEQAPHGPLVPAAAQGPR